MLWKCLKCTNDLNTKPFASANPNCLIPCPVCGSFKYIRVGIGLQAKIIEPISEQGLSQVNKKARIKWKEKYGKILRFKVSCPAYFEEIDTEQKICAFAKARWGEGDMLICGRCGGRNKYHNKSLTLCRIQITKTDDPPYFKWNFEHPYQMPVKREGHVLKRLHRYFWWKGT